ncbi:hypothetical protein JTB14_000195 [Gonioctena quinquepunctata]|nr:hypothetical protein JTB14_000195 [Gonioctena quinquepunctata]
MEREYEPVIEGNSEKCSDPLNPDNIKNNGPIFGKRHIQVIMYGFLYFLTACNKTSMSISILAMTNPTSSNPDIPDEEKSFPLAVKNIRHASYVDDFLGGAPTYEVVPALISELIALIKRGGFELQKWSSNDPFLLSGLPESYL